MTTNIATPHHRITVAVSERKTERVRLLHTAIVKLDGRPVHVEHVGDFKATAERGADVAADPASWNFARADERALGVELVGQAATPVKQRYTHDDAAIVERFLA